MRFWRANCNAPMPSATRQSADGRRLGAYLIAKAPTRKKNAILLRRPQESLGRRFPPQMQKCPAGAQPMGGYHFCQWTLDSS